MSAERGALALVLHTHMPYVEGFGTWPFGEEWLWEAIARRYLPLLDLLDGGAPLTLSLTPVLVRPARGARRRAERFLASCATCAARPTRTTRRGCATAGDDELADELERPAVTTRGAAERFEALGGDLLGALAPHAAWTSAATHAVLPLLATDAGVRLQVGPGSRPIARASAAGAAASGCPSARTHRGSIRCSRRRACAPPASS